MYESGGIHEFAMVLSIPSDRLPEWDRILRRSSPPIGIRIQIRSATLVLFSVQDDLEFVAIEKAEKWLQYLAASALPSISLNANPQPIHEV